MRFSFDPLPAGFVLSKPLQQEAYDPKVVEDLDGAQRLVITRKRDGWKLFVVKYQNTTKIYTDGLKEITHLLPHIALELRQLPMPNRTILVGEGVFEKNGADLFTKACSCLNPNRKDNYYLEDGLEKISLILFDVVFWGGAHYGQTMPYFDRLMLVRGLPKLGRIRNSAKEIARGNGSNPNRLEGCRYIRGVEWLDADLALVKDRAVKWGWEGLVLYDRDFRSDFRINGKNPQRIKGCYKWKPIHEDDFIIRTWDRCENNRKRLKDVNLRQIDPATGKEFDCGKLGGFSEEMRRRIKRMKKPLVLMVKYEQRFPSGKLRNARFMRIRADKKTEACIAPKSFNS
ncbi:MAG: hypothetical protein Q8L24_00360 [bacterium]|nr:hypothetical protein [bacterium]